MNKIKQAKEEGIEELTNHEAMKFANSAITLQAVRSGTDGYTGKENLTDWLKSHQTTLLQAVLDEVDGRRKDTKTWKKTGRGSTSPVNVHYNQALTDIATIINKAIEV